MQLRIGMWMDRHLGWIIAAVCAVGFIGYLALLPTKADDRPDPAVLQAQADEYVFRQLGGCEQPTFDDLIGKGDFHSFKDGDRFAVVLYDPETRRACLFQAGVVGQ